MKKGYRDAAITNLRKVREGSISLEIAEIEEQIRSEQEAPAIAIGDYFKGNLGKRVFIAVGLQVAQQLTGVNAFLGYASTIFSLLGVDDPLQFNVIWNAVMVAGCLTGLFSIDSYLGGRRKQLLLSSMLMAPALLFAGFTLDFNWDGAIAMVCLCIFGFLFQYAWGIVTWLYPSEIFALAEKERAISFSVFVQYMVNFVVFFVVPKMVLWNVSGTMYVFAACNFLNLVFVFTFIVETRGVPLEEVHTLFDKKSIDAAETNVAPSESITVTVT